MNDDILVAFVTSGCALVATLITVIVPRIWKNTRELKEQTLTLDAVRAQVQNDHGTNLRDDIDAIAHRMDMVLEGVSAMHLDVAWLRREQQDLTRRIEIVEDEVA